MPRIQNSLRGLLFKDVALDLTIRAQKRKAALFKRRNPILHFELSLIIIFNYVKAS